jgi:uncharacterized protein
MSSSAPAAGSVWTCRSRVHEDMTRAFRSYPQLWALSRPDANIDHRRVPNLQTYLRRSGAQLPSSRDPGMYRVGDLVTWMLSRNLPHIVIVIGDKPADGTPLVVRNIGRGAEVDNILFSYPITGHYRYAGQ